MDIDQPSGARAVSTRLLRCLSLAAALSLAWGVNDVTAQDYEAVQIRIQPLRGGVALLIGQGGNMAALSQANGLLLVDDQFGPLGDKIRSALGELGPGPLRFIVNTHWHGDHTGGNEGMAAAGAVIVAHDNVRERMSRDQFISDLSRQVQASPVGALPVATFSESLTFHFGDETVRVQHVEPAHTDGDALVHFEKANVIHMGDTFFNGMYPFIDRSTGGRLQGLISAADLGLALSDENTMIIPGHGPLADREQLSNYRDMLVDIRDTIRLAIHVGKSREAVVAARPTRAYDDRWGRGFVKPDVFTGIVYESLKGP